jgi:hypothetical protein
MLALLYIVLQDYIYIFFCQNCNSLDKHATSFFAIKGMEI